MIVLFRFPSNILIPLLIFENVIKHYIFPDYQIHDFCQGMVKNIQKEI